MAVRSTMSDLIAKVRLMIGDIAGATQFFADQDVQNSLDETREDRRYEELIMAPTIVNNSYTQGEASLIYADYYSTDGFWEADATLQANYGGQSWVVVTPVTSDYLVGHWTFEANVFTSGTAPGQYPPVFITGKIMDVYASAADLLTMWAGALAGAYDISVDGQNLRRSQLMTQKLALASTYLTKAKPRTAKMLRGDVAPVLDNINQTSFPQIGL